MTFFFSHFSGEIGEGEHSGHLWIPRLWKQQVEKIILKGTLEKDGQCLKAFSLKRPKIGGNKINIYNDLPRDNDEELELVCVVELAQASQW